MAATIDDTYAEAFRSIYASVLVTARDRYWLDRAVQAATGNASSTILCDCEAGLDQSVGSRRENGDRDGRSSAKFLYRRVQRIGPADADSGRGHQY